MSDPHSAPVELRRRIDADPQSVERDLASLVLTVVELLRQLIERQALRRIDVGDLSDEKVERMGTTLMMLDARISELCDHFGIRRDELNIDLGPLGPLLAQD
jgi:Gas vesicle protein K